MQFFPSPKYPSRHWQINEPGVLVQFAFKSQSLLDSLEHSSISNLNDVKHAKRVIYSSKSEKLKQIYCIPVQFFPCPKYPSRH